MSDAVRYDSVFRYHVPSDTRHETKHLVELDAYKNNGKCTCEHFTFKLDAVCNQPRFQPGEETRCKHIKKAREAFTNEMIEVIRARQIENGDHPEEPPA